jgi:prepilin-type N-terminal cleavage/methylation domain-containing protein
MQLRGEGKNSGFTIIEILIAVAMGSMVLAAVYGAYHMIVKTTRNYSHVSNTYQTARIVLDTLAKEIGGAYQPLFGEEGKMFVGVDEWYGGMENDSLSMVTTTSIQGEEDWIGYDSFEVKYSLGRGTDEGFLLMETSPYFNLEEPFRKKEEVILADNIRSLDFKYYNGIEWVDTWGGEEAAAAAAEAEEDMPVLPYGVKITISIGMEGEKSPKRFSVVTSLPMTPRPLEEEEEVIEE